MAACAAGVWLVGTGRVAAPGVEKSQDDIVCSGCIRMQLTKLCGPEAVEFVVNIRQYRALLAKKVIEPGYLLVRGFSEKATDRNTSRVWSENRFFPMPLY